MKDTKIAVFEIGGRQHLVHEGDAVYIDNMDQDLEVGAEYVADKVMLVHDPKADKTQIGKPYVSGAKVKCTVLETGKGKKVSVIRYRAKSRHFVKKGHRQPFTKLQVVEIT